METIETPMCSGVGFSSLRAMALSQLRPSDEGGRPRAMLVVGARPNFVKIAPIVRALDSDGRLEPWLVHTGQHYDASMSEVFFKDLGLPPPRTNLEVGSSSQAEQTGAIMVALEGLVERVQPATIVTVGDVTSTLAAALVAAK